MLSLDLARAWMERRGGKAFAALRGRVEGINGLCRTLGFFRADAVFDPVRITVDTASADFLRRRGISPEMNDDRHVVLLPSPFNSEEDFARLEAALKDLPLGAGSTASMQPPEIPACAMTPREALEAPGETVETAAAAGRVAAECACPCPPGVPIVMPGELITENLADALKNYGVKAVEVVK